jgi:hypothetical protein
MLLPVKNNKASCLLLFLLKCSGDDGSWRRPYDWEEDPMRETVCNWLTEHHINWQMCAHVAEKNTIYDYQGQIYLDVPFNENDPQYQQVRDYLENPDGTLRFETVGFWYLTLELAMKNAHHDESGFWE